MLAMHTPSTLLAARAPVITMREATWKPGEIAPSYLDGSFPADAGCDPLCLAALAVPVGVEPVRVQPDFGAVSGSFLDRIVPFPWSVEQRTAVMANRTPEEQRLTVEWMREAEIKHSRLAMLAVVGWSNAELLNPFNALEYVGGRVPALFNGGLGAFAPFLLLAAGGAAYFELQSADDVFQTWLTTPTKKRAPGDLGFDPLELAGKELPLDLPAVEIYNGRLAMLAITGFAVQEFLWQVPVVEQTPFFFGR
jgi:light-harvesting complex II chlorophyll a/b binding protein 4